MAADPASLTLRWTRQGKTRTIRFVIAAAAPLSEGWTLTERDTLTLARLHRCAARVRATLAADPSPFPHMRPFRWLP